MLALSETINLDFQPSLNAALFKTTSRDFINEWQFEDEALPAPTIEGSGLKAAVWLPRNNIQVRGKSDVPVLGVSVPEDREIILQSQLIWHAGSLPLRDLVTLERDDIQLARSAIEKLFAGPELFPGAINHLLRDFEIKYVS